MTLPDNVKTTHLKWLSIWCRAFSLSFGDVFFQNKEPKLVVTEEAEPEVHEDLENLQEQGQDFISKYIPEKFASESSRLFASVVELFQKFIIGM